MKAFTEESFEYIAGYEAVRTAAKDFETYSSDLQGDRDVRDYRQLPLEADPPKHTSYRHAVQPLFLRPRLEAHAAEFQEIASQLLDDLVASKREFDVYGDFALPFVVGCLSVIYARPQDRAEWISWGPDVWTAAGAGRDGKVLHGYIDRVFREPSSAADIWGFLKAARPGDQELTADEFKGYAGVLLAGGRDTVIKLVSGIFWHLLNSPSDANRIEAEPDLERGLINELLRFLSPLPAIERVKTSQALADSPHYFRLHFASANFDPEQWQNPERIDIFRGKQPHLAFGYGPHTCLGMNLAEYEAKAFLSAFLPRRQQFVLSNFKLEFAEVAGIRYLQNLSELRVSIRS